MKVRAVVAVGQLGVRERWGLCVASAHVLREALDPVGVVAFDAEVLAGDEPVGPLAGAGCLDVGGLLARLPAAGDDERAGDGCALGAVDVLGVAEPDASEVLAGDGSLAAGHVELDHPAYADIVDVTPAEAVQGRLHRLALHVEHAWFEEDVNRRLQ